MLPLRKLRRPDLRLKPVAITNH